jgi:hypothetical protein
MLRVKAIFLVPSKKDPALGKSRGFIPIPQFFLPMKVVSILLTLLFLAFASFQFNDLDGDGWIWIAYYLALALVSGLAAASKLPPWAAAVAALVSLVAMVRYLPGLWEFFTNDDGIGLTQGMSDEYKYIEQAREFGGLLIGCLAMLLLSRKNK